MIRSMDRLFDGLIDNYTSYRWLSSLSSSSLWFSLSSLSLGEFVLRTIPRANLWEIHTPQVSSKALFLEGFEKVKKENLEVTDDVSVIEVLGRPVKLTLGNINDLYSAVIIII